MSDYDDDLRAALRGVADRVRPASDAEGRLLKDARRRRRTTAIAGAVAVMAMVGGLAGATTVLGDRGGIKPAPVPTSPYSTYARYFFEVADGDASANGVVEVNSAEPSLCLTLAHDNIKASHLLVEDPDHPRGRSIIFTFFDPSRSEGEEGVPFSEKCFRGDELHELESELPRLIYEQEAFAIDFHRGPKDEPGLVAELSEEPSHEPPDKSAGPLRFRDVEVYRHSGRTFRAVAGFTSWEGDGEPTTQRCTISVLDAKGDLLFKAPPQTVQAEVVTSVDTFEFRAPAWALDRVADATVECRSGRNSRSRGLDLTRPGHYEFSNYRLTPSNYGSAARVNYTISWSGKTFPGQEKACFVIAETQDATERFGPFTITSMDPKAKGGNEIPLPAAAIKDVYVECAANRRN